MMGRHDRPDGREPFDVGEAAPVLPDGSRVVTWNGTTYLIPPVRRGGPLSRFVRWWRAEELVPVPRWALFLVVLLAVSEVIDLVVGASGWLR